MNGKLVAQEPTAAQVYVDRAEVTKDYLVRLAAALQGHTEGKAPNWAHAGDLGHINDLLKQAVCFLTGEEEEGI